MTTLTEAQQQCFREILQNAYDAGYHDHLHGRAHRWQFGKTQAPHMVSLMNGADKFDSTCGANGPATVQAFAEEVKQLCEDYSGRDGSVYIKDVQAAIDALLRHHIGPTFTPEELAEPRADDGVTVDSPAQPLDMVLHCPKCGKQHIDQPETDAQYTARLHESSWWELGGDKPERWTNPPHKSHLCRREDGGCGAVWRPADVPTNGVQAVSRGKADTWPVAGVALPAKPMGWALFNKHGWCHWDSVHTLDPAQWGDKDGAKFCAEQDRMAPEDAPHRYLPIAPCGVALPDGGKNNG